MATTSRDPRTIVTPDAFSVHPPLLGTPLARPWRRGVAVLIDLILVGFITAVTSGVWFILGVVAAAFFFTRARKPGKSERASKLFRVFLGCMGVSALSFTVVVFFGLRFLNQATDDLGAGFSIEELAESLGRGSFSASFGDAPPPSASVDEPILAGLDDPPADQADPAVAELPDLRLAEAIELAEDTIGELERSLGRANRDLEDTRAELDEALQEGGLVGWLTSRVDSFGFGLGWWALYFAILMPWMKGQTPGKRALGVRVVRLDGQPVTWWHAFERAGGYAAGLATGTLGFLQIYWDANRQAIHDKVAGTVVIRDGVPKVPGSWERLVAGSATQPDEAGPAEAGPGKAGSGEAGPA